MAYKARLSPTLDKAKARLDGLAAIDPNLDLGQAVSVAAGTTLTTDFDKALSEYNKALNTADNLLNVLKGKEKELWAWSAKALNGVKFKYGPDSSEYEMAGGVRQSERKKPVRKPKTPPTAPKPGA